MMTVSNTINIRRVTWATDQDLLQAIRTKVFVEEQNVPAALEWDEQDDQAYHWLAFSEQQAVGCCRMLRDGHIGRMAVLADYRNTGVGKVLLAAAITQAKTDQLFEVYLYAQTHAIGFYRQANFTIYGEDFLDAGIAHRRMRLQIEPVRKLGIHGGDFAVSDYRQTCNELIQQTRKQLRILSFSLDHVTFDNPEMEQHFSTLARSSRYTDIRILIVDSRLIVSRGHRLLRLQRRLTSSIQLRKTSALPHDIKNNLVIADHCGIICQSINEPENCWANFNNHPVVENHIAQFDDLWERGSEDQNLRQLEI